MAQRDLKLLLDQNLSFRILRRVRHLFPVSAHVSAVRLAGKSDEDIWSYAMKNGFCIVSKDADFNNLSILRGSPPKVVYLRCWNADTDQLAEKLVAHADQLHDFANNEDAALFVIE